MLQGANCSGLQTQGVILSRGGGGWGQALGLPNKVLLSLLPPTSFTCKSVCAHSSRLRRAHNLPSPRAAVPARQRGRQRDPQSRSAAAGAAAGRGPRRGKASRGGFGLRWRRRRRLCSPFLFLNSIALMEANQKESPLRPGRRTPQLGGVLSLPAGSAGTRSGCRAAAAAAQDPRRFPELGAAPLPRVRPPRLGLEGRK